MVLRKRNLPLYAQEDIASDLGLVVPERYRKLFPKAKPGKKPAAGWGTQADKEEYSINAFFKKHGLLLHKTYFPLSRIKDAKKWIAGQIKNDNDILACFNYGKLYNGKGEGHVSVLDSICGDVVILIDPEKDVPKYREVSLEKLLASVKFHGEKNMGGFWIIASN